MPFPLKVTLLDVPDKFFGVFIICKIFRSMRKYPKAKRIMQKYAKITKGKKNEKQLVEKNYTKEIKEHEII